MKGLDPCILQTGPRRSSPRAGNRAGLSIPGMCPLPWMVPWGGWWEDAVRGQSCSSLCTCSCNSLGALPTLSTDLKYEALDDPGHFA